ncbi:MAG: lytic transglycosylase domain-containing protein [Rhodospirillales bacterium]|nr:lytic transglycosylase domain-containing protein [Alphaproteobacteria bacterium]MCB9986572.1 lytic transglycosylase domain-containing protein [Rhodospirillales bacterium]USO06896.1 MAG: lytic transglycosylase domain-containing protein [Rhodospirillales bacterium]
MINHLFAACLMIAAQTYAVPPQVLVGILHVEGGRIGQQVANTNGTYDLGPMQINTIWLPQLARNWGVSEKIAMKWVRDDGCTNVNVSAWILRQHLNETGSLARAVANYHSRTPSKGFQYKQKVVEVMRRKGLLARPNAADQTAARKAAESAANAARKPAIRFRMGRSSQESEDKG